MCRSGKKVRTIGLYQRYLETKKWGSGGEGLPEYPRTFQQERVDHCRWAVLSHWKLCQAFQHSWACGVHHQWTRMSLSGCRFQRFLRKSILHFSLIVQIRRTRSQIKTYLHHGFFATDFKHLTFSYSSISKSNINYLCILWKFHVVENY